MSIRQYLNRYAEDMHPESDRGTYQHALVVPLYDEDPCSIDRILTKISGTPLVVAVVNVPDDAPIPARERTRKLLPELTDRPDTIVVDRASAGHELPRRQGVGLARKIGTDLALKIYAAGQIRSPWLYQTDADAILPANYFDVPLPDRGAVVFGHTHKSPDPDLQAAADLYDAHMNHYVAGLKRAGSTYAFQTLGSTIAIHAETYAGVRGYPRRNAAEDFYLLNKTAKTDGVTSIDDVCVTLYARTSERVPFGTGPALKQILEDRKRGEPYRSYHPGTFDLLDKALRYLELLTERPDVSSDNEKVAAVFSDLGFETLRPRLIDKYRSPERRAEVLIQWFDGFRTLRFIHEARRWFPDQPLEAIRHA